MKRLHTGVTGLDDIIEGGYPKGRSVLILGNTGSGKTILGISFIQQACSEGSKSMIIATEELPEDILIQSNPSGNHLKNFIKMVLCLLIKFTKNVQCMQRI